jgi:hypothetical protein
VQKPAGTDNEDEPIVDTQEDISRKFQHNTTVLAPEGDVQTARHAPSRNYISEYVPSLPVPTYKGPCFRIRFVPPDWSHEKLLDTIYQIDPPLRTYKQFWLSLSRSGSTQTALLIFEDKCTEYFLSISLYKDRDTPVDLVIDRHFHGMTVLHTPPGGIAVEYVLPCYCSPGFSESSESVLMH